MDGTSLNDYILFGNSPAVTNVGFNGCLNGLLTRIMRFTQLNVTRLKFIDNLFMR